MMTDLAKQELEGFVSSMLKVNGLDMHVVTAGNERARPILFLHGFPDYWGAWRDLMWALKGEFYVIAPDLRGYNQTSKPEATSAYNSGELSADGLELMEALGLEDVVIVAHDWGATMAFWMAIKDDRRIKELIILNGTHPHVLQDCIWDDPAQRSASQYIGQIIAGKAAAMFNAGNARSLAENWYGDALKSARMTQLQYDRYIEVWTQPNAWEAMMKWYQASGFDVPSVEGEIPKKRWTQTVEGGVSVPVSLFWGRADTVFAPSIVNGMQRFLNVRHLEYLEEAKHMPHRDDPEAAIRFIRQIASS